jgi:hypothetical protein
VGHLERRRTNIHAIEKSDHIEQEEERQEPSCDATAGALTNFRPGDGSREDLRIFSDGRHGSIGSNLQSLNWRRINRTTVLMQPTG